MCGIYGMAGTSALRFPDVLERMGEALRHRGPDGSAWFDSPNARIGTERLRIIDLHERADQPFASPDGKVWLEANGEIYNAAWIRARYPDYPYRSHSDVETILPLYLEHGANAVSMLDGMFGLAIWDGRTNTLTLARARAGEKPIFYTSIGGEVLFSSELQCLLRHPEISRELDRDALQDYLALGYTLEPRSPFKAIRRVPAGTIMRFTPDGEETTIRYWDPASFAIQPRDPREAVAELQRLFEEAVTKQVMPDVPVGVFISGGLDSSLLATLASKAIGVDKVHTFSAQFAEESYDESRDAAELAKRMRTRHIPVRTDEETLREALHNVTTRVAEPLADPAILPTFLLARAAREHVKVVLSGEGADELFGGYPTYLGHRAARLYRTIPGRGALRWLVDRLPTSTGKVTLEFLLKQFVAGADLPLVARHLTWFGALGPDAHVLAWATGLLNGFPGDSSLNRVLWLDFLTYLPDNLLVKVDRGTMLASIEARAPYLDRAVMELALPAPAALKVRAFTTKAILTEAARGLVPEAVIRRKKRGLSVPVARWLNAGLRSLADRYLAAPRLFPGAPTARLLAEHRSGARNNARKLWPILIAELWAERWQIDTETGRGR